MIITPEKMINDVLKCLENSLADLPEDKRETVKIAIFNAWSNQMFNGKKTNNILPK
jgi:hypothetical protein